MIWISMDWLGLSQDLTDLGLELLRLKKNLFDLVKKSINLITQLI